MTTERSKALQRYDIVKAAHQWLGTPYQHQASLKGEGCDCLGLVRGVWRMVVGGEPQQTPIYSMDVGEVSGSELLADVADRWFVETAELKTGCMLLFRWHVNLPAKHLGILVDEGDGDSNQLPTFIHAQQGSGVCQARLGPAWQKRLFKKFEFPGVID